MEMFVLLLRIMIKKNIVVLKKKYKKFNDYWFNYDSYRCKIYSELLCFI